MNLGEGFIEGSLPAYLSVIIPILAMILINRTLQIRLLYSEISKVEDTKMKHVSEYKFLDRYGEIGEYLRWALKLYDVLRRELSGWPDEPQGIHIQFIAG